MNGVDELAVDCNEVSDGWVIDFVADGAADPPIVLEETSFIYFIPDCGVDECEINEWWVLVVEITRNQIFKGSVSKGEVL